MKGHVRNRIQIQSIWLVWNVLANWQTILRLLVTHAKELGDIISIITYTTEFVYKLITGFSFGFNVWWSITTYMCTGINSQPITSVDLWRFCETVNAQRLSTHLVISRCHWLLFYMHIVHTGNTVFIKKSNCPFN